MAKLIEASFWSMLSELTFKVVTPVTYLILTRFLNPDEFGAVAVITTIVAFLAIVSDLGVAKLVIQNNDYVGKDRLDFLHHCFSISLVLGIVLMLLLNLLISPITSFFSIEANKIDFIVLSFNIPFLAVNGALMGLLKKNFEFKKIFKIRFVSVIFPSLLTIVLVLRGYGITAMVLSQLISSILSVLLIYFSGDYTFRPLYAKKFNKQILGRSIWNSLEQIFTWLPMSIDVFMINNYLSKGDLGLYTTSRTIFTSAIALSLGAISPVAFSLYSKYNLQRKKMFQIFQHTHYLIFLLATVLGTSVFLFFNYFEDLLFNNNWEGVTRITSLVFILLALNYFVNPFQDLFNAIGWFRKTSLIVAINLIFTIPFLFIGIKYGLYTYLIIRFSFLFLRIVPIGLTLKKIDRKANMWIFFFRTKYIWLFLIMCCVIKFYSENLYWSVILYVINLLMLFYFDWKKLNEIKTIFTNN